MASLPLHTSASATASSSILLPRSHNRRHHLTRYQLSPLITANPSRRCSFRLASPPCARPQWIPCRGGRGGGGSSSAMEAAQLGKVRIRIRLDHQVEFGETVVVFGSHRPLGSWRKSVPLAWTEGGWVTDLVLDGGDFVEYKFVILSGGGESKVWEDGENRVLEVPRAGVFDVVCRWNMTEEAVDLICVIPDDPAEEVAVVEEEKEEASAAAAEEEEEEESDDPASGTEQGVVSMEDAEQSPAAMEQRQGRPPASSIVDPSEQRSCTEMEGASVTAERPEGLPPLKLQVRAGRGRTDWWRKLIPPETSYDTIDVLLSLSQGVFLLISALHRTV